MGSANKLCRRYATLQKQIDKAKAEQADLRPQIMEAFDAEQSTDTKGAGYAIKLVERRRWTYPEALATAEAEFKKQKQIAQLDGSATATVTRYIQCKLTS